MTRQAHLKTILTVFLAIISPLSLAQIHISETTLDGLSLVENTKLALVYAQAGADFSEYNKIYLADASIAFKKNSQRNQNRSQRNKVNHTDMARIKSELSSLFGDVFSQTLEEAGYKLVSERGEDVLLIKPAIINLDITAPDTKAINRSHTYSESAGEMTLYMELFDSNTDDLIAKALDRQLDRRTGFFQWHEHINNRAAANRILQAWATVLKEGLDDARNVN